MAKIIVPMATGFEEIEAVTIIDILRRADIDVIVAGLKEKNVEGAHGIKIECDVELESIDVKSVDGIVLPGGLPGSTNLLADALLREIIIELDRVGKLVSAICAAPIVLSAAGVLTGKKATCYPSFEEKMEDSQNVTDSVVVEENIITSRGPGTAIDFALEIVKKLVSSEVSEELRKGLLAEREKEG